MWSDADHRVPWTTPPLRKLKDAVEHRRDGLHVLGPLLSLHKVARADVTLAVLENSGLFLARQRLRSRWRSATSPLVIMSCWLAESARHFDGRALEWHRETLRAADAILFWSSNQRKIFRELLGVPDQRLRFVPFGIDHRFFSPGPPGDESYVFSAGNDRARDYGVLLEAAAGLDVRLKIASLPGPVAGLAQPPNFDHVGTVSHRRYRDLLNRARVVVVPSTAPAYPSGQTVMLEAMAMGKCCIVTDSAAIRDYVQDSQNARRCRRTMPGRSVPQFSARWMMVTSGNESGVGPWLLVEERFNSGVMWHEIGSALRAVAEGAAPSAP